MSTWNLSAMIAGCGCHFFQTLDQFKNIFVPYNRKTINVNQVKELPSAKHFLDFERWQFLYPC